MVKKINVKSFVYPPPEGGSMRMVWGSKHNDEPIYYVVLGEDFLRGRCQKCINTLNMEFGWKSQQGVPLFVCSNIRQLKPTIEHPIQWEARLAKGAKCSFFVKK